MVLPPPSRIGDIHLVAENVPDNTGLHPGGQGLVDGHGIKPVQTLVFGQAAAIDPAEHLFQQFPKFTFSH